MRKLIWIGIVLVMALLVSGCTSPQDVKTPSNAIVKTLLPTSAANKLVIEDFSYMQYVNGTDYGTIAMFSSSTCPHCIAAKKFLTDNNIEFWYMDLDTYNMSVVGKVVAPGGTLATTCSNIGSVPMIVIGDKCIIGDREADIKAALGI